MIKYLLKCKRKHEFESWFSNSKEFEKLKKKNLIECIFCNSKEVEKSIKIKKDLQKIQNFVKKNFEFVGDEFTRKVREIYYDNKKSKNIYGTVSPKDKEELENEGIELSSIPWINDKEN